jgi:hypothetical protein
MVALWHPDCGAASLSIRGSARVIENLYGIRRTARLRRPLLTVGESLTTALIGLAWRDLEHRRNSPEVVASVESR